MWAEQLIVLGDQDLQKRNIELLIMKQEEHQDKGVRRPNYHHSESSHGARNLTSEEQNQHSHHARMILDYRRRFWISLILTLPILGLSPLIQQFCSVARTIAFPGDSIVLFALSSIVYFYGGWPFLKGVASELKSRAPGMMSLIALAITTSYVYSGAVVFGVNGSVFFWELATLIDVMLLGHWLEMRSIVAASSALEELAKLMPSEAHKIMTDGTEIDVPRFELAKGDRIVVKPGEKIPADGVILEGETSVNEAMLTGESTPALKRLGSEVIGGSLNGEGSISILPSATNAPANLLDRAKQSSSFLLTANLQGQLPSRISYGLNRSRRSRISMRWGSVA